MTKAELPTRYARQFALEEIGEPGQKKIAAATVAIVGLGGIGNPAAAYLAAAGVGRLKLNDFDDVDESNLARQFLFSANDIGRNKAEITAERLKQQNPDVRFEVFNNRFSANELCDFVADVDVVIDASDNFATRHAINQACVKQRRILLSGAAIRSEGQIAEFGPDYKSGACYACAYPEANEVLENCQQNGILGPVAGVIGCLLASRALLRLAGHPASTTLSLYDGIAAQWNQIKLSKVVDCPTCD